MPGGVARGQNLGHLYFGSKFWFKFDWWCTCISHEPMIRNHSYFNHRYPIGFALFLSVRTLGPCPGVGARGQNLGHIENVLFLHSVFLSLCSYLNKYLKECIPVWIIDTL